MSYTSASSNSSSSSSSSASYVRRTARHTSSAPRTHRRSLLQHPTALLLLSTALILTLAEAASAASLNWASSRERLSFFGKRAEAAKTDPFAPLPNAVDYYNPLDNGGQMLTIVPDTGGLGEPLNIIISGRSSASVLKPVGFLLWATSVNMGVSCLGQANGTEQEANLGDGLGGVEQGTGDGNNGVLRFNYYSPYLGTCKETFEGGNHLRWFIQNGSEANSSAFFMAVSVEKPVAEGHDIVVNGYNEGRDQLVANATLAAGTEWEGNSYNTTVTWVPAGLLLNATSDGINHADTVALKGQPAQDGRVAVLTITQLAGSDGDNASPAGPGQRAPGSHSLVLALFLGVLFAAIMMTTTILPSGIDY